MRWTACLALLIVLSGFAGIAASGAAAGIVTVMFDFGDGNVLWADVPADVPTATQATAWSATVAAAQAWGLNVSYSLYEGQVFVLDIGRSGAQYPDWWHLLVWEAGAWTPAPFGVSQLDVSAWDVIGWYLARDDASYNFAPPVASPDDRLPVTTFRYDARGRGVSRSAGPGAPRIAWSYDTGAFEISATPAVARGTVFLPTWTGLVAVSEADGHLRWRNPAVAGASSPTLYGDFLYVGGRDGRLHAVWTSNGTEAWNVTLQPDPVFSGITASPRIAHGKIYVGTFNESGGDGRFAAIDVYTHAIVWSAPVSSIHYSSAAIANGTAIVGLMGHLDSETLTYTAPYGVAAFNAETGESRWFVATNGSVASSPAVSDGFVYVTTKAGELFALTLEGAVRWTRPIGPSTSSPAVFEDTVVVGDGVLGTAGGLRAFRADGEPLWNRPLTGPVSASPTVDGFRAYAATNEAEGRVVAVDLATGEIAWSLVLDPHEYLFSSPVVVDGALLIASDNGRVYSVQPLAVDGARGFLGSWEPVALTGVSVAAVAIAWLLIRRARRAR